ncbi:MAG: hypothetical protein AB8G23_05535 [Myxococcota bacterium]
MLPFFAILLFSLIGIGAMVIDGGLALTEQTRLETAAEMMVSEWAHVESLPTSDLPSECVTAGARQTECLEATYIAPLLNPLGVELADAGTPGGSATWTQNAEALDGQAVDARGAHFGALDPEGLLDDGDADNIRLRRSSPLLFGWATIPAQGQTDGRPDFLDVQAARAEQGLTPELGGSGLYGEGFNLNAAASTHPGGVPAMRVGPPIPHPTTPDAYLTGGAIGVAWLLSDLLRDPVPPSEVGGTSSELAAALNAPPGEARTFRLVGTRLQTEGGENVACVFDVEEPGDVYVGLEIEPGTAALAGTSWPSAYLAVVDNCDMPRPILGFLEVGFDANVSEAIQLSWSAGLRRNASASAALGDQLAAAAPILGSPSRARLEETSAWQTDAPAFDLAVRVPLVRNTQ